MAGPERLTRRRLLGQAAVSGASLTLAGRGLAPWSAAPAAGAPSTIPLPSPAQVRADFQRMVDFGPRLTGSDSHNRYIAWLEGELTKAGVRLSPCDSYVTERWLAQQFSLDVLDGAGAGPVKLAGYYPRSKETPPGGLTAPLVYGGTAPAPSINADASNPAALAAALARYPSDLASWASALPGRLSPGALNGSILVVDVPMPVAATTGILLPSATYLHWSGHTEADFSTDDYKRLWLAPGVTGIQTSPFQALGAVGVVYILDSSYAALEGGYLPFENGFEPLPALYVDRDTGAKLRAQAGATPRARLTLTATHEKVRTPSVVGVLPGSSEEAIILNTHTDGQGFVEENCGVALVHLARYFGSLPASKRLKRTLVFSAFTGHMGADLPQLNGFIQDHPDLIKRAAAAITIEHFGCSEWVDEADGYHPTGNPELFAIWTTQGTMQSVVKDSVIANDLPRTALLRPPVQFGVGGAFQSAGVPQVGAIAGPNYLLAIKPGGDMDKLDEGLAAKQIAWTADLVQRLDPVPAADLRQGDPTLGQPSPLPSNPGVGHQSDQACATSAGAGAGTGAAGGSLAASVGLELRVDGRRSRGRRRLVELRTRHGRLEGVQLELRRNGRLVTHAGVGRVSTAWHHVALRRTRSQPFVDGHYVLSVRRAGKTLMTRKVTLPPHRTGVRRRPPRG